MPSPPRTIGQVLEAIRGEFPDISVSKLRYLESEGLVSPERDQPSGYRRFRQSDIDRLVFVLRAQRDKYLPLKVIREQLDALDRGEEVPSEPAPPSVDEEPATPVRPRTPVPSSRLVNRRQIMAESGLGEAGFIELERLKLISVRRGTQLYGREAVAIAVAAKRLGSFGVDARQLRVVQQAAATEAALVEQALAPYQRRSGVPKEILADLYRVILQAHAALLHSQING
ncbi:transcriptional regulator FtsR [Tessaracoccus antarcticus]|uniref:MerR family transcriptional regulator n=1 Tax=Tessaracoccus antarcticus TaxID=2479848 RepID=A0A3M0GG49_9ACTN|nr:MerR family transcriptional regulator [Tessaracoccus antarcticus]RMB60109.1 MerR family transcriptional regulator [Tessaracoccus antarcticus]